MRLAEASIRSSGEIAFFFRRETALTAERRHSSPLMLYLFACSLPSTTVPGQSGAGQDTPSDVSFVAPKAWRPGQRFECKAAFLFGEPKPCLEVGAFRRIISNQEGNLSLAVAVLFSGCNSMLEESRGKPTATMVRMCSDVLDQQGFLATIHPAVRYVASTLSHRRHVHAHVNADFLQRFPGADDRFTRRNSAERRGRDAVHVSHQERRAVPPG